MDDWFYCIGRDAEIESPKRKICPYCSERLEPIPVDDGSKPDFSVDRLC